MFCFLIFTAFYYLEAGTVLIYKEHKLKDRYGNVDKTKAKALDRAIGVTNFSNAVISTILSSVSLYSLKAHARTNIYLSRPSSLAQWTIESVCGYIFVELTFILVNSFRLSEKYWKIAIGALKESMMFHAVGLMGLTSVLIFNAGYTIALWVIWSELTSILLGIEDWMEETGLKIRYPFLFRVVEVSSSIAFIFQRVVVFFGLLWLCGQQFTWQPLFIFQLSILCVGTLFNSVFAMERLPTWNIE